MIGANARKERREKDEKERWGEGERDGGER